ncbi:MAG: BON domain-containing protein [Bacteroidales bacterium]
MKRLVIITGLMFLGLVTAIPQQKLDDADIADAIENECRFDHAIDVNKIDVEVLKGIAELTGTVHNLKAKERATRIAELVKGVRAVSNRIEVDPPVVLSDAGIRDHIVQALLDDPATDSYEIGVDVNNKVVTLTGTVDSYQEKMLSEDVAKSVTGVVGLNSEIDIDYKINRPDGEILQDVREALKWSMLVDEGLIDVDVKDGTVELSGIVGSSAEKANAFFTSWVTGVRSVNTDGLEVQWWAKDEDLRKNQYTAVADDEIEDAIMDAAMVDPRVVSSKLLVEAENGWVTLRGTMDNLKAKTAAEKLAEHTTGVTGVTNRIKVRVDLPPTDEEVMTNISMALANNAVTEAWQINVDVNYGIVTLTGTVDSYLEKKEAEWVTSGIEGVNEVNNQLTVNYPYSYFWWGYYPYYNLYITPPQTTSLIPNDDRIKKNIASEIWWSPFVDRDQVTITVQNGEVTLEGTVDSWREYRKAAENAWEGGAFSVDNKLVVK